MYNKIYSKIPFDISRPNWLSDSQRDPKKIWLDKNENTNVIFYKFNLRTQGTFTIWTATDFVKLTGKFDPTGYKKEYLDSAQVHKWKAWGTMFNSKPQSVFTYGFEIAEENFKKAHVNLYTLSNYQNLLNLAVAKKYITEEEQATLKEWNTAPESWGIEV